MASLSGASKLKNKAKTSSKMEPSAESKSPAEMGSETGGSRAVLPAVEDELHELAELVAIQPQLRRLSQWMEERVVAPHEGGEASEGRNECDRIGELLRAVPRDKQVWKDDAGEGPVSEADVIDFRNALEVINAVVHLRLQRLAALIASS